MPRYCGTWQWSFDEAKWVEAQKNYPDRLLPIYQPVPSGGYLRLLLLMLLLMLLPHADAVMSTRIFEVSHFIILRR